MSRGSIPQTPGLYQLGAGDRQPVLISALADLARTSMALRTVVNTRPADAPRVTSGSLHLARTARTDSLSYRGVREASEGSALRAAESILSLALEP